MGAVAITVLVIVTTTSVTDLPMAEAFRSGSTTSWALGRSAASDANNRHRRRPWQRQHRRTATAISATSEKREDTAEKTTATNAGPFSLGRLFDVFSPAAAAGKTGKTPGSSAGAAAAAAAARDVVGKYVEAVSRGDVDKSLSLFSEDVVFDDYSYTKPCTGKAALERRLRLQMPGGGAPLASLEIDDVVVGRQSGAGDSEEGEVEVGIRFSYDDRTDGRTVPTTERRRGLATFSINVAEMKIERVDWVVEPAAKSGETSLRVLSVVSKLLALSGGTEDAAAVAASATSDTARGEESFIAPERYFEAWNRRDMDAAASVFTEDVSYDDTVFPQPFAGIDNLKNHLIKCASVFPPSFTFQVDDKVVGSNADNCVVRWHVENNGKPLPYTRGISFYELTPGGKIGKIRSGIDMVEPSGPIKPGGVDLFVNSLMGLIAKEPVRIVPIAAWVAYMYVVFFSDGILPGANALALEERTWKEVVDLSLNFFLVSPLLNLPFSPVVHPMLEGVFNLLLSWAAMFAGFLGDDRRNKPNLIPMLPIVVGMQFLTSAFLLPYLATRSTETSDSVFQEDLGVVATVCESRALGASMGIVGSGAIVWAFLGRTADFGVGLNERWTTFIDLLSIDRVGSSFIVDLVIFGLFQAWLVDDDLRRRGMENEKNTPLALVAKYLPFFGMAAYLMLRPPIPSKGGEVESSI